MEGCMRDYIIRYFPLAPQVANLTGGCNFSCATPVPFPPGK
jgi:hypothetical protein